MVLRSPKTCDGFLASVRLIPVWGGRHPGLGLEPKQYFGFGGKILDDVFLVGRGFSAFDVAVVVDVGERLLLEQLKFELVFAKGALAPVF